MCWSQACNKKTTVPRTSTTNPFFFWVPAEVHKNENWPGSRRAADTPGSTSEVPLSKVPNPKVVQSSSHSDTLLQWWCMRVFMCVQNTGISPSLRTEGCFTQLREISSTCLVYWVCWKGFLLVFSSYILLIRTKAIETVTDTSCRAVAYSMSKPAGKGHPPAKTVPVRSLSKMHTCDVPGWALLRGNTAFGVNQP